MWKWLIAALVLLAVLCGGGGYFVAGTERGREVSGFLRRETKATEVRVDPVARGSLARIVSAPGTIEPRTRVQISAQVVARIVALPFREGDHVRQGDVVARLDAEDLVAQLESTRASLRGEEARLEGLKAELANAESELARVRGLFESGDRPRALLEATEAAYHRAKAAAKQSEHAIEIARANIVRAQKDLDNTVIASPMDGTITQLNAEVGELVVIGTLNNAASVIMEIADLSVMLVKAKVDETNIAPVLAGQPARVYISAYPDRTFEGRVELVGLKKELDRDGTGFFETEVLVRQAPGDTLRSGLTANVEIEVETFDGVLKVPSQAVVDRRIDELPKDVTSGSPHIDATKVFARVVYRLVDGKARPVPVSIGSSDATQTIIVAGLAEGDRVITGPYKVLANLRHGQAVTEQGKEAPKTETPAVADTSSGNGKS